MAEYEHLPLARSEPVNERRTRPGRGPKKPDDPKKHAHDLLATMERGREQAAQLQAGFDSRLLLKLDYQGDPDELRAIPGLDVVSQEEQAVVVIFATEEALEEFKKRISQVADGRKAKKEDLIYAVKAFDTWTPEDRAGLTLRREPFPKEGDGWLDVELWPMESPHERDSMVATFRRWCAANGVEVLDTLSGTTLVLLRVRTQRAGYEALLTLRDVRALDLPPKLKVGFDLLGTEVSTLAVDGAPNEKAPKIAILDSGIVAGHPLLSPAVGEAASFLPEKSGADEHGHGTMVAGLALYGDVRKCIEEGSFSPRFHILSGRITDENNEGPATLIENKVAEAVGYFAENYGCRIFNLSVADERRVYHGGHVGPWASTLDELARELGVLIVVSSGNFGGTESTPKDWLKDYPGYLLKEDARLLDPAPAINVLTVGSIARQELTPMAERFPRDPADRPVARGKEPSPFTRSGPGSRGSIKPELVHYGGNGAVAARHGSGLVALGEISTGREYSAGRLFQAGAGTSFAAPKVAHLAARIMARYPTASANLVRTLITANARIPGGSLSRLSGEDANRARFLVGYGFPDDSRTLASTDAVVGLVAEEEIAENYTHYFELPIPESFYTGSRRVRQITVALAHTPVVRRSRVEYKASHFEFRVVRAKSLEDVARIFKWTPKDEKVDVEGEVKDFEPKITLRGKGTVQAATWTIKQPAAKRWKDPLFIVVTRRVPGWAQHLLSQERYALAMILDDSVNQEARLYAEVRALLQARAQVRPRVRF